MFKVCFRQTFLTKKTPQGTSFSQSFLTNFLFFFFPRLKRNLGIKSVSEQNLTPFVSNNLGSYRRHLVLPEYSYGALLTLIACFAAFILIKKPSLNRKQK
jgi:hypothetical protein